MPLNRYSRKQSKHNNKFGHGIIVGLIYANWCGHCKALKPEWKNMKKILTRHPKFRGKVSIIEIEDSDPAKVHKIAKINRIIEGDKLVANGYPTIFKKNKGMIHYFNGGRNSNELIKWAMEHDNNRMNGGYILHSTKHSRRTNTTRRNDKKLNII